MHFRMAIKIFLSGLLLLSSVLSCCSLGFNRELTIYVDAGKAECFFTDLVKGDQLEIDYQVIDGELEISFTLNDPLNLVIVSDLKKQENNHHYEAETTGTYRFCFDNQFSMLNRKTVFFEVLKHRTGIKNSGDEQWLQAVAGLTPEEVHELQVQEIMGYMDKIRESLSNAQALQNLRRSHEARDRNLAEANFQKVNQWSLLQLSMMIAVGLLQVYLVRSIFETDSRVQKLWNKLRL